MYIARTVEPSRPARFRAYQAKPAIDQDGSNKQHKKPATGGEGQGKRGGEGGRKGKGKEGRERKGGEQPMKAHEGPRSHCRGAKEGLRLQFPCF